MAWVCVGDLFLLQELKLLHQKTYFTIKITSIPILAWFLKTTKQMHNPKAKWRSLGMFV